MGMKKSMTKIIACSALALSLSYGATGCGSGNAGGSDYTNQAPNPPPGPGTIRNPNMQEGIQITSWWYNDYLMAQLDNTLDKMLGLGVESISILATYYQDSTSSTTIYPKAQKTPLDDGLETIIAKTKSRGMRTVLKPHIDPLSGWRGDISFSNEADWAAWFTSYNDFIMHYAQIAEDNGVDMFVIGTELKGTSQRPEWSWIIDNVRSVYHGKIVYAADHSEYQDVPFWDKLDYIGVNAYFELTNSLDPAPEDLDAAFQAISAEMQQFSQQKGKKIMITEIGYQSYDGTNMTPWWAPTSTPDQQEQADCYAAAFRAFFNKDFIAGMYFWDTHWNMADLDGFGFVGKEAEAKVNEWYHKAD